MQMCCMFAAACVLVFDVDRVEIFSFLPMFQCLLLAVLQCPAADSFSVSAECVAMTAAVSFRVDCSLCFRFCC